MSNLRTRQVAGLSVDIVDTIKMLSFSQFHIVEQPERSGLLAVPHDLEILLYSDVIVDAHGIEVFQPLASDELPGGHKMTDGIVACDAQEAVYKFYPLLGVGIAPLVHHLEEEQECHSFVNDVRGEDVYVGIAELQLVRSIARSYGPDTGISFKMRFAMRSVSITHSAMNRWILRSEELAAASLSNAASSFIYATCCPLQRAHIIMLITLIRARFIDLPKWVL